MIPAAGRGTRAYPYTKGIPKGMLEVGGEPNLARVIALMRDQMKIADIVVVIGSFGHVIREYFDDGSRFGVRLTYVENRAVEKGLSHSILLSRPHVDDYFCVILADECYIGSNHAELLGTPYRDYFATCAVAATTAHELISENYAVHVADGLVRRIVEKPHRPNDALLGMGTFVFSPQFYDDLEAALASRGREPKDPVSILGRLCERGVRIAPFYMRGAYVNINSRDQLSLANNLVRSSAFDQNTLALVLIMKGSVQDTLRTVEEFRASRRFRQVLLVTPPHVTQQALLLDGVTVLRAESGSYGEMMRTGLDRADADILVTAFSDGSFTPADVPKFLEYLKDADFVVGTRTTRQLIQQGTNMRGVVRLAHVSLAKLLEFVWWGYEPRFTDVGCAYRALWSSTYRLIRPRLRTRGPEFFVEMLLETLKCRKRVIEIPVSFQIRHKGMKEKEQTVRMFATIAALIVKRRLLGAGPPWERGAQ